MPYQEVKDYTHDMRTRRTCCRFTWDETANFCGYCAKPLTPMKREMIYAVGCYVKEEDVFGVTLGPYQSLLDAQMNKGRTGDYILLLPDYKPLYRWHRDHWKALRVVSQNNLTI